MRTAEQAYAEWVDLSYNDKTIKFWKKWGEEIVNECCVSAELEYGEGQDDIWLDKDSILKVKQQL